MKEILFLLLILFSFQKSEAQLTEKFHDTESNIFIDTEIPAAFPGGYLCMMKYINDNLIIPDSAFDKGFQGTLKIQFTVNEDGTLSDIVAKNSLSVELDKLGIILIKNMPKWTPGISNGKHVKTKYYLPLKITPQ